MYIYFVGLNHVNRFHGIYILLDKQGRQICIISFGTSKGMWIKKSYQCNVPYISGIIDVYIGTKR